MPFPDNKWLYKAQLWANTITTSLAGGLNFKHTKYTLIFICPISVLKLISGTGINSELGNKMTLFTDMAYIVKQCSGL